MRKSKRRVDTETDREAERNLRGRKREEMKVVMGRAGRTGCGASRDGVMIGNAFLSGIGRGIRKEKVRSVGTAIRRFDRLALKGGKGMGRNGSCGESENGTNAEEGEEEEEEEEEEKEEEGLRNE